MVERQGRDDVVFLPAEEYQRLKEVDKMVAFSGVAKLPGPLNRKPFASLSMPGSDGTYR